MYLLSKLVYNYGLCVSFFVTAMILRDPQGTTLHQPQSDHLRLQAERLGLQVEHLGLQDEPYQLQSDPLLLHGNPLQLQCELVIGNPQAQGHFINKNISYKICIFILLTFFIFTVTL
jgi:hypothetical protein